MNIYLILILLILISRYLLSVTSDWLNIRHISDELPDEFHGYYDAEKYRLSQSYLRDNTKFDIFADTIQTIATLVFILVGGFNFIDRIAIGLGLGSIPTGLVFAGILVFGGNILGLPFSIYSTFVIEERFGFNRTTPRTFVQDTVKAWILTAIIGGAVFAAILLLFDKAGDLAWIYCWIVVTLFQFALMFLAPLVILPLFNKFDPLDEGELKNTIESYADRQNFKMRGVFRVDGSRRSSKSNAFFTGFGHSRRIVLFDTLIDRHSVQELVAIVAHEMGHYKKRHMVRMMIWSVMELGLVFFLLSRFVRNEQLFSAFKMEHLSVYASLFFFGFLYAPIGMATGIVGSFMSRRHEFQADAFAVETCGNEEAMITSLKKLSVDNLSNLTPHPLKIFLSYSHPPVIERITAIRSVRVDEFSRRGEAGLS